MRCSFAVPDETTGDQQRFTLPGESLAAAEHARLLAAITASAPAEGLVVLSCGVAPGLPNDFPRQVQTAIGDRETRFAVDTSKALLHRLIAAPVAALLLLRVDRKDAPRAAHQEMDRPDDRLAFSSSLIERGVARHVLTGRGAEGWLLVTPERRYLCHAHAVPVSSPAKRTKRPLEMVFKLLSWTNFAARLKVVSKKTLQ